MHASTTAMVCNHIEQSYPSRHGVELLYHMQGLAVQGTILAKP